MYHLGFFPTDICKMYAVHKMYNPVFSRWKLLGQFLRQVRRHGMKEHGGAVLDLLRLRLYCFGYSRIVVTDTDTEILA